jgi:hypothetical protein
VAVSPAAAPAVDETDRNVTIGILRAELRRRTGRTWSVTGGKGTSWGWITVTAPPARRDRFGSMTEQDAQDLARALDLDTAHHQGVLIPASSAHRREYLARVREQDYTVAAAYWD